MLDILYVTVDHRIELNFSQESWKNALGHHCNFHAVLVDKQKPLENLRQLLTVHGRADWLIAHLKLRFLPEDWNILQFSYKKAILESDAFLNFADDATPDRSLFGKLDRIISINRLDLAITRDLFSARHFRLKGVPTAWSPQGVDPSEFRGPVGYRRELDIVFIGSTYVTLYPERRPVISHLKSMFPNFLAFDEERRLWGPQYIRTLRQTKIFVTCPISPGAQVDATEGKLFEAMACGCCVFRRKTEELDLMGFVPGKHYVAFCDFPNLTDQLKYYLAHEAERVRIARNGQELVTTRHTWELRAQDLIHLLEADGRDTLRDPSSL